MTYDAYKLFSLDEFEASGLVSRTIKPILEGISQKEILITKGNSVSILYDGIFLSLNLNDKNPFEFEDRAIFLDPDRNVWLGIKNED